MIISLAACPESELKITCCCKVFLGCIEQLNPISKFPCLSPTSHYQFYMLSTPPCNSTLRGLQHLSLSPVWKEHEGMVCILPLSEASLQKAGKLTSVLNTAHLFPNITRTQRPSCIHNVLPRFCTLLLL